MQSLTETDTARIADLVVASRILEHEGILDSYGHVSVRSERDPSRFFMPRAMPPGLVSEEDVVELDMEAKPVESNVPRLNGERYIHSEIYKARPDVQAVIHSHSQAVIPFGVAGVPLRPVVAQAGFLPPQTPLFEVRDATGDVPVRGMLVTNAALGAHLAKTLGDAPAVLLRGHGDAVVGASIKQATVRAIYTSINARMQAEALRLNPQITPLDDAELAFNAKENFDVDRPWRNFQRRLADRYAMLGRPIPAVLAMSP